MSCCFFFAIAVVEGLGINEFTLAIAGLALAFGSYLVSDQPQRLVCPFKVKFFLCAKSRGIRAFDDVICFLVIAVVATGFAAASHGQPSGCWCCCRFNFCGFVVFVMECLCAASICVLFGGSDNHRFRGRWILPRFRLLRV